MNPQENKKELEIFSNLQNPPWPGNHCKHCGASEQIASLYDIDYICQKCALIIKIKVGNWGRQLEKTEIKTKIMEQKLNEEIRHFKSGAVRGAGGKFDFPEYISPHLIFRYAEHMRKSAVKYGAGNWKKSDGENEGIPREEYFKSLCRHFFMLFMEETEGIIMEPGSDHLASLIFNIQGLIDQDAKAKIKSGQLDNLYGYEFEKKD